MFGCWEENVSESSVRKRFVAELRDEREKREYYLRFARRRLENCRVHYAYAATYVGFTIRGPAVARKNITSLILRQKKKNGINTGRTAVCLISRGLTKRGKTNGLNSSCRRPGLNEIPANATRVFIRLFPFALFPVIIICSSEITYLVARRC